MGLCVSGCVHLSGCVFREMCVYLSLCSATLYPRRVCAARVNLHSRAGQVTTSFSLLLSAVKTNGLLIKTMDVSMIFLLVK